MKLLLYIIVACCLSGGAVAMCVYWGKVLPLEHKLDELNIKLEHVEEGVTADAIRDCCYDILVAVSLREANQVRLLAMLDEKRLPADIQLCSVNYKSSLNAKYVLWRIKQYSKDFAVKFSKDEMEILSKVPDKRPEFPGKIGNE